MFSFNVSSCFEIDCPFFMFGVPDNPVFKCKNYIYKCIYYNSYYVHIDKGLIKTQLADIIQTQSFCCFAVKYNIFAWGL